MKATATQAHSTTAPDADVRNATTELRMTERLAAEYWAERARPIDEAGNDECIAKLTQLYQWPGDDLRDAEAKLEVALVEIINGTNCTASVDAGIALLIAPAWLDIRRIRGAEQLAREEANG